jgi:hypothetical protein
MSKILNFTIGNLVSGPFRDEAEFKGACVKRLSLLQPKCDWFLLETEETVPGMPDAMRVSTVGPVYWVEFKIGDKDGIIKFKKSQPLFYRTYGPKGYFIDIYVWDSRYNRIVCIGWQDVVAAKSLSMKLPEVGE